MKIVPCFKLIGILMLFAVELAACDSTGPAEATGKQLDEPSAKTGDAIDDAGITAQVKAAIFSAPGLKSLKISVDTRKGVVTLRGSTDSASSSARAQMLAGSVAGVEEVENRLAIVN
jgi:hyperosmotically inducible protein